jgi:hypothetical protein
MVKDYYSLPVVAFSRVLFKKEREQLTAPSQINYEVIGLQSFEYYFESKTDSSPDKNPPEAWAKRLKLSLAVRLNSSGKLLYLPVQRSIPNQGAW